MEYNGKIYGKAGDVYFPLSMTSEDVDKLQADKDECLKTLKEIVSYWDTPQSGGLSMNDHIKFVLDKARKAIKKATGKNRPLWR
jgi:hypothetical protein